MLNIAVFVSGRGSNLRAIHEAVEGGALDAKIVLVLSSRDDAPALAWAAARGIRTASLQDVPANDLSAEMLRRLDAVTADFIALAGYMKRIPEEVVHRFSGRMLNVHPALLPSFGGRGMFGYHVHEAVLAAGVRVSGATVHIVDEEYDRGPIVLQRCVPVEDDDTAESLAARVLTVEHELLPAALQLFSRGLVHVRDGRVHIKK
ncbi:MAG: phosphoribosylglycinamide formyltransferase [Bacteroidota bacterium]|nr:phosphoribosylglycinamide formyltransferase [Bacteroidota bacterium]